MNQRSLTRSQVREVDRIATREYGIPGIVLMENAGLLAALEIERELVGYPGSVAILCGGGNNGGDGYVIARQLSIRGHDVRLYATHADSRLSGDAATNRAAARALGLIPRSIAGAGEIASAAHEWRAASILVDALLGTGFRGQVRSPLDLVLEAAGRLRHPHGPHGPHGPHVVAIDLPSGLDCDTGVPAAGTLRADVTLTFVARKLGFDGQGAADWTGEVRVLPIGAPGFPPPTAG